jgi:hypothetical protein
MAEDKEHWEVTSLPAEAEENDPLGRKPGEWLWDNDPAYKYGERLRHEKKVQTPRNWIALYQQRPVADEGNFFLDEWFRPYVTAPERSTLSIYGGSDYAVTADGGDYTCHVVIGQDSEGRLWLLDLWRRQASTDQWIEALADLVRKWRPLG